MSGSCLFYGELGGIALDIPAEGDAFTITKELCNVGYFEFAVANTPHNRTTIDANYTLMFYIKRTSDNAEVFRGRIGKRRYIDRFRMQLSGYEWYVTLADETFKHMHETDLFSASRVWSVTNSVYTDVTTGASDDTINDVPVTFTTTWDGLFIGYTSPFSSVKIKYSTKGVRAANFPFDNIWIAYNRVNPTGGFSLVTTVPCLDLSHGFTKDVGTYYVIFDAPPNWTQNEINGETLYWLRIVLKSAMQGTYSTQPQLDRIWVGRATDTLSNTAINPFRIAYRDTAANTIMSDVLAGTGFALQTCPSTEISIRGDYQTPLQWIAAVATALSWTDGDGYENPYEWSISTGNSVSILPTISIPETPSEDGQYFSLLDAEICYDQVATRIIGLGAFNGAQQAAAYAEDYSATDMRELVAADLRFANQAAFDEHVQKALTGLRVPPQEISVSILTSSLSMQHFGWIDDYAIGQKVQIQQPVWGIANAKYRIMRASIGPIFTKLDLSTRRKHLESLRADLAGKIAIADIWPAGAALQVYDGGYA